MKGYKVLGDRVKKIRLENNMTQQEFAEALGYSHKSMVNKIETGETEMSFDKVIKLILTFDVNAAEFLDLSDEDDQKVMKVAKQADKPNWKSIHPLKNHSESITYIKPTLMGAKNIEVGEYSYYEGKNFLSCVTHHDDFLGDKLIIGKFCQIGRGVEFVMNGANHPMNALTAYPFYLFQGWEQNPPDGSGLDFKGDTVIGNDVWIGQNATILPGIHIGDGCIVGTNATVGSDLSPYSVAIGNPAKVIRMRFDEEMISLLEKLRWWDLTVREIQRLIPVLSLGDLTKAKEKIKDYLEENAIGSDA